MDELDDIFTEEGLELLKEVQSQKAEGEPEEDYEPTGEAFVEVPPDDAEPVADAYRELRSVQMELGSLFIHFEQQKEELLSRFENTQDHIKDILHELEREYKIPHGDEYTFNVPSEKGEEGVFYRKDLPEEERQEVQDKVDDPSGTIEHTTVDTSTD